MICWCLKRITDDGFMTSLGAAADQHAIVYWPDKRVLFDPLSVSIGSRQRACRRRRCARSSPRRAASATVSCCAFFGRRIVKEASERANVRVLALRTSKHGLAGEAAPVHPHLFRHARVRQIVRTTRNLPLAQRQAGWTRLQMAYLTIGDEEARQLMQALTE